MIITLFVTACTDGNKSVPAEITDMTARIEETFSETETTTETTKEETEMKMNIQIGEHTLTATLAENSSAEALIELLRERDVTVNMHDYANMEKVGVLPESLPRNDVQTTTEAGDLILYLGNSFVIYYDANSWNFTRLGKIDNITQKELMDILGDGDVTAVLSLSE
ncbi:MAG: cyclophilin-like fold protein [Ruminococcus sp.]|nr:cyclophilin-like fold protein [Ruminococcus sp.]